jgi:hypothetical protein
MNDTDPAFTLTVIGTVLLAIWVLFTARKQPIAGFSDFGQGLLGIASLFALLGGVWLFYLQGTGRPRQEVVAVATVAPLGHDESGEGTVLVQLIGRITNRGAFPAKYECVGEDVRGFRGDRPPPRNPGSSKDLLTEPLAPRVNDRLWRHCMQEEGRKWQARRRREIERLGGSVTPAAFTEPNSGVRFSTFTLEPGETGELDFEVVVPCRYAAVRLHFAVPKPDSISAPEAKAVVSLIDACRQSAAIGKAAPAPAPAAAQTRVEFGEAR